MSKNPNAVDIHIGARVRLRRMTLGVSQEKLAEKLGITFQQVQKYEKGINRISASRLQDIASALDLPIAWFFEDAADAAANGAAVPDPLDRLDFQIARAAKDLAPAGKQSVLAMINALVAAAANKAA